jgi:hypothetical protein
VVVIDAKMQAEMMRNVSRLMERLRDDRGRVNMPERYRVTEDDAKARIVVAVRAVDRAQ